MTLHFDPEAHIYTVDGLVIPSVTQVLREAKIIDYSMIPQDVLQKAARRGKAVHAAIEYLLEGQLDRSSVDSRIQPYLDAAERFLAEARVEAAQFEQRKFHAVLWYAGTYDVLGTVDGQPAIVDWKTGAELEGHRYQLAGYAGLQELPMTFRRMTVYLRGDGTYRTAEYRRIEYRNDFEVFRSARTLMNVGHWMAARKAG